MLVTVGATGFAAMMSPDSTKERVSLLKNEKGALKEGGTPEKVAGDYAYDWPKLLAPLATAKP
jgi:hypothetical protein